MIWRVNLSLQIAFIKLSFRPDQLAFSLAPSYSPDKVLPMQKSQFRLFLVQLKPGKQSTKVKTIMCISPFPWHFAAVTPIVIGESVSGKSRWYIQTSFGPSSRSLIKRIRYNTLYGASFSFAHVDSSCKVRAGFNSSSCFLLISESGITIAHTASP